MVASITRPLDGVRVIDLTANMTGPFATMILGDQGADVIKVEPPGGEVIRRVGAGRDGMSAYFANLNRSKRSIVVDLSTREGSDVLRTLALTADVMIQNFRPGVIERMGLGSETVRKANPSLVYVSINGYGQVGPLANAPAYDHVVQAMSGMAALQAGNTEEPSLIRHGVIDKATGLVAAESILAALVARGRTGNGDEINISMLEVALHFLWPDGMMNHTCLDPVEKSPPVSASFRLTRTEDGYLALNALTNAQWTGLMQAVGLGDDAMEPEFQTVEKRMRNGGRLMREAAKRLAQFSTGEALRLLQEHDVPCAPVLTLDEVLRQEQVEAMGILTEAEHPVLGCILQPRSPARFDSERRAGAEYGHAPTLGQHTSEILAEADYSLDDVSELRRVSVVA